LREAIPESRKLKIRDPQIGIQLSLKSWLISELYIYKRASKVLRKPATRRRRS
jgi:hypothetical protein